MAEPTLKDLLGATAEIRTEMATMRAEMATKDELNVFRSEMSAFRSEVKAGFGDLHKELGELDKDLTAHMKVHRELEKDIELLKRRPPRTAARAPRRR